MKACHYYWRHLIVDYDAMFVEKKFVKMKTCVFAEEEKTLAPRYMKIYSTRKDTVLLNPNGLHDVGLVVVVFEC